MSSGSVNGPSSLPSLPQLSLIEITLNLTPEQLDSLEQMQASGSTVQYQSSAPFSLLDYLNTVGTATLDQQKAQNAFDTSSSVAYRDLHADAILSSKTLQELISSYIDYQQLYDSIVDQLKPYLNHATSLLSHIQSETSPTSDLYTKWSHAADDAYFLIQAANSSPVNPATVLADYNKYIADSQTYNSAASSVNTDIANYNSYLNTIPNVQQDINNLNALGSSLGGVPGIPPINNLNIPHLPTYQTINTSIPAPPWTNVPVSYPPIPGPTSPGNIASTVPGDIVTGGSTGYNATFITPLTKSLKQLKDQQDVAENNVSSLSYQRLTFGQTSVSALAHPAEGNQLDTGGSSGAALAAASQTPGQNTHIVESYGRAILQSVYNTNGVPSGSPLVAHMGSFAYNVLESSIASAVPEGTNVAKGALLGPNPQESPIVQAATALSLLSTVQGLITSNALLETVKEALLSEPGLAGLTNEQIDQLAQGISSAIALTLSTTAILQVAAALGLSGLLPQIIANLGLPVNTVAEFINGQVSYQNLSNNPLNLAAVQNTFTTTFQSQFNLTAQVSQNLVNEALTQLANLGPFNSESEAQQALSSLLLQGLTSNGINAEEAQQAIQSGFDQIASPPPFSPPVTEPTLPTPNIENNTENEASLNEPSYSTSNPPLPSETSVANLALSPLQQLNASLNAISFNYDLEAALSGGTNLDKDEVESLSQQINQATANIPTVAGRAAAAEAILNAAGVDNAAALVNQAATQVQSPLRSFTLQTVATPTTLATYFTDELTRLLVSQGVRSDTATAQAENYASQLFTSPTSITKLVSESLVTYAKATQQSQSQAATQAFNNSIRPMISTLAFEQTMMNPAHALVFYNAIFYGGISHSKTGPGGGVDVNPTSFV